MSQHAGEDSGITLPILWMDETILAVNKPAGVLSIPGGSSSTIPFAQQLLEPEYGRLWPVHRLDKDTSGLLLFARTPDVHRTINFQFEYRQVKKQYQAIVIGLPSWEEIEAEFPLKVDGDRKHRTIIDPKSGRPAQTSFSIMNRYQEGYSLLSAQPHTGFTHQIRAHISWLGYPIAMDPLYQVAKNSPAYSSTPLPDRPALMGLHRLALHASSLTIIHPKTAEMITLTAPLPEDFTQALQHLHPS